MLKKKFSIIFVILMFLFCAVFIEPHDKLYKITEVISPISFKLEGENFLISDLQSFDINFSENNKFLANKLNITEEEAFVLGNLARDWASNLMKGRKVYRKTSDLIFNKYSYRTKFLYSGFCIVKNKPYSQEAFEKRLKSVRNAKYKVIDLKTYNIYEISDLKVKTLEDYVVIRKNHISKTTFKDFFVSNLKQKLDIGNIQIYFADSTSNLNPDRSCSSAICKEILNNINNAQKSIDMAIYGYSSVPDIEAAIQNAIKRQVKIRLVYDINSKGENIYPNTNLITKLISDNKNDLLSPEVNNIMHNKFYIFDEKTLITGSANLSHTDMSGFNSNSIVVINSPEVAKIYKQEFEQMYNGKFHNEKHSNDNKNTVISGIPIKIYFSPQDKSITNAILPLINNAKKYIYIPTFVLTEKRVANALIQAKNRGVKIKIIIDALSASNPHSKHSFLRLNGIPVKTENYAGKMHSKSMIVDDKYTVIGSMNFSNSGEKRNDENLILINDEKITRFYKDFFLYQWDKIDNKWLNNNVRAESLDSIGSCYDGIDNNYDGLTDSDDIGCKNK